MYYYNHKPATLIFQGNSVSNIEIFPEDISFLLDKYYGENAIINTWAHCAKIKAWKNGGQTMISVEWDGYRAETPVIEDAPIFIGIRESYVKFGTVKVPQHLNDRVKWALYLRHNQYMEDVDVSDWPKITVGAFTLAYNYSSDTATYPDMFKYTFDGFIKKDDAIRALEICLEYKLYNGNVSSRIQYLLETLKK